jgi:hypothetical protein
MMSALDAETKQTATALANAALATRNRFDFTIVTPPTDYRRCNKLGEGRSNRNRLYFWNFVPADGVEAAAWRKRRLRYVAVVWADQM